MPYVDRTYRRWPESELHTFQVRVAESDLWISAERPLADEAERALRSVRADLEQYLERDPDFTGSLKPRMPLAGAPPVVLDMTDAARLCDVGPMAAVAGAVAERVGKALLSETGQVMVENGGDIFIYTIQPRVAAIFAGESPLSGRVGIHIRRIAPPRRRGGHRPRQPRARAGRHPARVGDPADDPRHTGGRGDRGRAPGRLGRGGAGADRGGVSAYRPSV